MPPEKFDDDSVSGVHQDDTVSAPSSDANAISATGVDPATVEALAELSARILDAGDAVAGCDQADFMQCRGVLGTIAAKAPNVAEQLQVWLHSDPAAASRRAQCLQNLLAARAYTSLQTDPGRAAEYLRALQRFGFALGTLATGAGSGTREHLLPAYANLIARLRARLATAKNSHTSVALLLVYCAGIGRVDADRGLRAGEHLRALIAHRLKAEALRQDDELESSSRSEFACILSPVSSEGVALLAAEKVLRVLGAPFSFGENSTIAEPMVGIAMFPDHASDAETLLQCAKAALRVARLDHSRYAVYRPGESDAGADLMHYAARLRLAVEQNTLSLAFQPQASLRTGRIVGAEALLRWNDEVLGPVPPHMAVAAAESSGQMHDLTMWVIAGAVQRCLEFRSIDPGLTVSINVSPSNLREPDLPHYIDRALRTWGVPGQNLVIEITETAMLGDRESANEALHALKALGVRLSVDDFGTGYSSMYYLAQLPLDELKIDLMFVRNMLDLPQHAKIVRSLIELAHNLELGVVAEGVENEAIWAALAHLGCDRAQGYHLGRPVPPEELLARLRGGKARG